MPKTPTKTKRPSVAARLRASLDEVHASLTGGKPLTMRTVTIRDPASYDAAKVKKVRENTGLSQATFAKLVGVSPVLVRHWEQSVRTPQPMACRLLDDIARDPAAYVGRYVTTAAK